MKIYVGNLPWSTTDSDLENLFSTIGDVTSASVVMDRDTGRSRQLRVNEATSQPRRSGGGGGGDRGGDRGGNRGGRW
jgi:hypothetical protein